MAWPMLAMMGANAALSMYRDKKKSEAMDRYNKGQAEVTRYSPWTGMRGEIKPHFSDPIGSGLQGGLSGAAMYGSMKGAGLFDSSPQGPSGVQQMAENNAPMYETDRFDQMQGIKDSSGGNPWMQMQGRAPTIYG